MLRVEIVIILLPNTLIPIIPIPLILSLIAAASKNSVIGVDGKLPWSLPDDLRHFRDLTRNHTVIMGRKTFESIGRPLSHRKNIVITRQKNFKAQGCDIVSSLDEAIDEVVNSQQSTVNGHELFIIGGADIYRQAIDRADRIYLTRVHATIDGDAFFPEIDLKKWKEISREEHAKDERHAHAFAFITYDRLA